MPRTRWPRRLGFVAMALLCASAACARPAAQRAPYPQPSMNGVPGVRLARLARCVDITRWFWGVDDPAAQHFVRYMAYADLRLIRQLGFTCVRLSIDPGLLYNKATPASPDPTMLGYVDAALNRLLAQDLAVVIDMHDDPLKPLEQDPDYASGFVVFWHVLARHFSRWDPDKVFLEALNEPVYQSDPRRWQPMQHRLLAAMRAGAPRMTLIATGPLWSSVAGLSFIEPTVEADVVYTFHFYDPATFTHQGAVWVVDALDRYMHDLPYPSTSRRCAAAVTTFTNADVRTSALVYCAGNWDAARVDGLIARAARWSMDNRVPVIAGEFGVYCGYAPHDDRLQWFRDVRTALQRYGIGWTLWGYDDCYGLGRHLDERGRIAIDWSVVQVLGLNVHAQGTGVAPPSLGDP